MYNIFSVASFAALVALALYLIYDVIVTNRKLVIAKIKTILLALVALAILFVAFKFNVISTTNPYLAAQFSYDNLALLASIVVVSSLLPLYYTSDIKRFVILFLALVALSLFGAFNFISFPIVALIGIGSIIGLSNIKLVNKHRKIKRVETSRDIFQIALGIAFLIIFIVLRGHAELIVVMILFGAYIGNSLIGYSKGRFYGFLSSFEREGVIFGLGALYLICSLWLMIGFLNNFNIIVFGIIALFIADSMATIVGIRSKTKLPYNKSKSIAGTLTYFAVAAVLGFFFIGYYAIVIGAILALAESINLHIDDNISIAILLIVIFYFVFALGVLL